MSKEYTIEKLAKEYERLVKALNQSNSIQFIIDEEAIPYTGDLNEFYLNAQTMLKKLAVYADKVIILKRVLDYEHGENWNASVITDDIKDKSVIKSNSKVTAFLDSLPKDLRRSIDFKNMFYFIPSCIQETEIHDAMGFSNYYFQFQDHYNNASGVYVSTKSEAIRAHLLEKKLLETRDLVVQNIWLPSIVNIPFEVFLRVRRDEHDSFARYQYALKKFLADRKSIESTTKLKELFEYVDYETRTFDAKLQNVKKSRALRSYEVAIGLCVLGLTCFLPRDISQQIMAVLGAYQGKEAVGFVLRQKETMNDLKVSDFYVPWLYNKKNVMLKENNNSGFASKISSSLKKMIRRATFKD